jgi:hypothetical protein
MRPMHVRSLRVFCAAILSEHLLTQSGETADNIVLGPSARLPGAAAALGAGQRDGARTYFNYLNRCSCGALSLPDTLNPNLLQTRASSQDGIEKIV